MRLLAAILTAVLLLPGIAAAAESAAVTSPRATATLVTDTDAVSPGQPFRAALRLRMAPGWHTYWRNPGDAGLPPTLDFALPQGTAASDIAWPAPARQPEGPLMTYGYSNTVLLPVTITPGSGNFVLKLHAQWLVCAKICIPEEGNFSVDLRPGPASPSPQASLFAAADARMPAASPWQATIAPDGTLALHGAGISPASVRDAWFIPGVPDMVDNPAPQPITVRDDTFVLHLKPAASFKASAPLPGVLVVQDGGGQQAAFRLTATPGAAPALAEAPSLWHMLGLAVLGGMILNLMPCVFPVLAIKAVGLSRLSGVARGHARIQALSFTLGVVLSFVAMGAAVLVLRQAGAASGWGFQFQSPAFVAGMSWLLLAVGLNLSGVFAVTLPVTGVGQALASRAGHAGSFFSGVLAVLVATPCTAPFMGVAIAAALAGTPAFALAVFAALGIGLALPYALLAGVPGFARLLPRPGRWMEVFRQALAFPMYAACVWLLWVMSEQTGSSGVLALAAGMVLVGFTAWAIGTAQASHGQGRRVANAAAAAAALAAMVVLSGIAIRPLAAPQQQSENGVEPFSPTRLAALREQGKPVFVNMTAAWCVTCLVNERVALAAPPVRAAFAERHVTYMKGDWTRQDPDITAYLHALGRDGVPLYVFYPAGAGAPVVLPQILTPGAVLDQIDRTGT
jgi:thiol:disulfide interchange protein/DsbC/DsbD-like thiol-disulfide interchange protein